MHCTYCGSDQHTTENCPKTWGGSVNKDNIRCAFCGSTEHNIETCPNTFSGRAKRKLIEENVRKV